MSTRRPPFIAGLLLRAWLSRDAQESLVGDMREEFARRDARDGRIRATLWYWRETMSAIVAFGGRSPAHQRLEGDPYVTAFFSDLRVGLRSLLRTPLSTGISVLTLALGIGAIGAVFSIVNPILLRPLPYPTGDRLVFAFELDRENATSNIGFATYDDLRERVPSLHESAAMGGWNPTVTGRGDPERVIGQRVSWNYFRLLGVNPALGRSFVRAEDAAGQRVVVLSHSLWQRQFGGDSSVIGTTIDIDGSAHLVVGVMGKTFENVASPAAQLWRTLSYETGQSWACRTCRHLRMLVRLPQDAAPGVVAAHANAAFDQLRAEFPREYPGTDMQLVSLKERMTSQYRDALLVLFAAAGLLALIAAANIVNLQLGRAVQREPALAVRMMLGASRARIMRLLFAEGFVLAAGSALIGVFLAWLLLPALISQLPAGVPRVEAARIDRITVGLLVAFSFLVALAVTLLPGMRMSAHGITTARVASRVIGTGRASVRRALVTAEVALALMLLVGAGLLSRSLTKLLSVNAGVDAEHVLTMEVQATGTKYLTSEAVWSNHAQMIDAVRAIPGVRNAGVASQLPLGGNFDAYGVRAFGKTLDNPELAPSADRYVVSPGFIHTMGTRLLEGRAFSDADNRPDAAPVAMVSASLAARVWPGESAIGKRFQVGAFTTPWREIVGVVEDVHHRALDDGATDQFYVPEQQWPWSESVVTLAVLTSGDPVALSAAVRNAVRSIDPAQPIMKLQPMTTVVAQSLGQRRLAFTLFLVFSTVAVILAAAGIYGVLATNVAARSREIGVRAALGATPGRLVQMVARDSAWLVGAGVVVGVLGVATLSRFLRSLLFGVTPADAATLATVVIVLSVVAMVAAIAPARRAARTDPAVVLRGE